MTLTLNTVLAHRAVARLAERRRNVLDALARHLVDVLPGVSMSTAKVASWITDNGEVATLWIDEKSWSGRVTCVLDERATAWLAVERCGTDPCRAVAIPLEVGQGVRLQADRIRVAFAA